MTVATGSSPSGRVTFLFTDIEGSTKRWDADAVAMQHAVRAHDGIMREAIASRGGLVFKTIGDAFCAVFPRAADGVAAALGAQAAIAARDFSAVGGLAVRMALNTGTADERDGDYFGPALNRVARLLAIAHGGQVLCSEATATDVDGALPDGATLLDLGAHRLRDLADAETVYQVVAPALRREFPPLRSQELLRNNLPADASSFIGRRGERDEIAALLHAHRAVTVVGPGGIGKSRVTLRVAGDAGSAWPDGVYLVEFEALSDSAMIAETVARAIDVQLPSETDATVALAAAIGRRRMLLVFDNSEHLIVQVAALGAALLRGCPNVAILASSRRPLGINGETLYRLPPLSLPPQELETHLDADGLLGYDAPGLFVDRASSADARFSLSDEIAPLVAVICRRLDGIPLAIELAAARVRAFGVRGVEERLDQRFRFLVGGPRDAAARQQTLEATIDWSVALLTERESRVFRHVGIFADRFTAEAAAFVCADGDVLDADDAFDVLASLDDQSLIDTVRDTDSPRFRLLESMRTYGVQRLRENGEFDAAARRHAAYFCGLAQRAEATFLANGNDSSYVRALAPEVAEIRSALAYALTSGDDAAVGAALASAVARPWARIGLTAEGIRFLEAFIARVGDEEPRLLARLWTALSWLCLVAYRNARALTAAEHGVRYARVAGDAPTLAWALAYFALVIARLGRLDEAKAALHEAAALGAAEGAPGQRLTEMEVRAVIADVEGDHDEAAAHKERYLALLHAAKDDYGIANTISSLAETEHARGNTHRAIELAARNVATAQRYVGTEVYAGMLANLGGYLLSNDAVESAKDHLRTALTVLVEQDRASPILPLIVEHAALAVALDGAPDVAARLEGYCDAALRESGVEREPTEATTHRRLTGLLAERLGEEALAQRIAEGARWNAESAVATALQNLNRGL